MEAILFLLDAVVFALMVYMGLRDARRSPGTPATSLFRLRDMPNPPKPRGRRLRGAAR